MIAVAQYHVEQSTKQSDTLASPPILLPGSITDDILLHRMKVKNKIDEEKKIVQTWQSVVLRSASRFKPFRSLSVGRKHNSSFISSPSQKGRRRRRQRKSSKEDDKKKEGGGSTNDSDSEKSDDSEESEDEYCENDSVEEEEEDEGQPPLLSVIKNATMSGEKCEIILFNDDSCFKKGRKG